MNAIRHVVHSTGRLLPRLRDHGTVTPQSVRGSTEKDWTVLVCMEGRERLAASTLLALNKLETVGSSDRVNVVAQACLEPTFKERLTLGLWPMRTQRFYIRRDGDLKRVNSPRVGRLPRKTRLNAASLGAFLEWGMSEFPARNYLVLIKCHGEGFVRVGKHSPLSAAELDAAFAHAEEKTGRKASVIAFDSCTRMQMEVAYQLRKHAQVMAGSAEDILANQYPYSRLLYELSQRPHTITAQDVGRMIVDVHRKAAPSRMQSAMDLTRLEPAAQAMRALVDEIIQRQVPPELVYTDMLRASSMQPSESLRLAFNFRDLPGFLLKLQEDEHMPQRVQTLATEARAQVEACVLDLHVPRGRVLLKDGHGCASFMPWQAPVPALKSIYEKLDYAEDSHWGRLLDYVFTPVPRAMPVPVKPAIESVGLTRRLGKLGLFAYKKYTSPFIDAACPQTPSCSQYAREAVERFGLVEGMKLGFMRVLSCTGHQGPDPVPERQPDGAVTCQHADAHEHAHEVSPAAPTYLIASPPRHAAKSLLRAWIESGLMHGACIVGQAVGGVAGSLLALPCATLFGAFAGARAGTDTIDAFNRRMLEKYRLQSMQTVLDMEIAVGTPAFRTYNAIHRLTGGTAVAKAVGGVTGVTTGSLLGMAGGLYHGFKWGARLFGPCAENVVKDALGELPPNPVNDAILLRDY